MVWLRTHFLLFSFFFFLLQASAQKMNAVKSVPVDSGWAGNSVNTVIFRKNALVTFKDTQFICYYDQQHRVIVGKRLLGTTNWQLKQTPYYGNVADAHNSISMMIDGKGYVHLAWDQHNNLLNYCRSTSPGSFELTQKIPMTGQLENHVSYPEFYKLPDGDLLFLYRDGASGKGNLVVNKYNVASGQWTQLHQNLIDGEGQRSAYWQACIDSKGTIHISWVWRESADVASNHDMAYACSKDGGITWQKSTGKKYDLPIKKATAEYAVIIPEKSELINQTSMFADIKGNPFIATYYRDANTSIPQYHLIFLNDHRWQVQNLNFRKTSFTLSGQGTKRIPISRPQVVAWQKGSKIAAALIFRDAERGDKVSVAYSTNLKNGHWQLMDIYPHAVGSWEPTFDTELWKDKGLLHLFVQEVQQLDAEGKADLPPQLIKVLEWKLKN